MKRVVFIGGGRITAALLSGLQIAKAKYEFAVHDRNLSKMRQLKTNYDVATERDVRTAASKADLLVVAVRPISIHEVLQQIGHLNRPLLAVSLAAGVPLRNLISRTGPAVRWARAMPSPVSRSGNGLTALACQRNLPRADRNFIRKFFANVGQVIEISERKFDAFTVSYSASHGYHALGTIAKAGQDAGLDRKTALLAAAHALADGVLAWREGSESLDALLHEAATPGGIAANTMSAMDAAGYRRAVQKGILAGLKRARANAKFPDISRRGS